MKKLCNSILFLRDVSINKNNILQRKMNECKGKSYFKNQYHDFKNKMKWQPEKVIVILPRKDCKLNTFATAQENNIEYEWLSPTYYNFFKVFTEKKKSLTHSVHFRELLPKSFLFIPMAYPIYSHAVWRVHVSTKTKNKVG